MSNSSSKLNQERTTGFQLLVFVLLVAPFFLNDFASIYIKEWTLWLFIDYVGVKLFPIIVIVWLIRSNKMLATEFGIKSQNIGAFLVIFLIVALIGTIIDQNGYPLISKLPGYSPLGGMPAIKSPTWDWIDLTLGLLLVGIVEELVFRGYMHTFLNRYTKRLSVIVAISSIIFGLIHWSLGLHAVLITTIIGAVFMIAYIKTRALPPIMLAHFAVNFIDFAGVIPKSIFKIT